MQVADAADAAAADVADAAVLAADSLMVLLN
jgi:hypothetical protein